MRFSASLCMLAAGAAMLALAPRSEAQTFEQQWERCENTGNRYEPDLQLDGCTAVIQSGREGPRNTAIAYYNRGNAFFTLRDYARAAADYEQAVRLDPDYAGAYYNQGLAYYELRDYNRSLASYNEAVRADPGFANAYGNRGNVYQYGLGDYRRAIADYDRALGIRLSAIEFGNRGGAYLALGDYAAAFADLDRASELEPQSAARHNSRCWARATAGRDLTAARAACDRAIALAPDAATRASYLDSRGLVGLRQQRWQDAWNDYDAAARIRPDYAHYLYGRGVAALGLGRWSEGQADIARAASLDADIAATYAGYGVSPSGGGDEAASPGSPRGASPPPPPPAASSPAAPAPAPSYVNPVPAGEVRTYSFYCPASNQSLRITFDADARTARITRPRRPAITLTLQPSSGGEFRYTRGDDELRGTLNGVEFREGRGEFRQCRRGGG